MKAEIAGLRQEVKAEIGNALNKAMLYFTALAAVLTLITFLR
jgi:Mg2+ and Co2+ transporter CorA